MKSPKVSVIVAVYNGLPTVLKTLDSLITQTIEAEIIVVDDGSKDGTAKKIEGKFGERVKVFKVLHGGPAIARNFGSSKAKGDILVFADADMTFDPGYLEKLIEPILKGEAIGTFTSEEYVANWENVWARCWNIEKGWEAKKRFPKGEVVGTDFRAIIKSEFDKVAGFTGEGYTDSWSLFQKLNIRPVKTKAICYHHNPSSLEQIFVHASWVAKRPYKLGAIGYLVAMLRATIPISFMIGVIKSIAHLEPSYLIFKLVYDLGTITGIVEYLVTGKSSK